MPLYEYQCQQCHRRTEKIQKFSDGPLTTCPHCGGELQRTLTAPAIQFKGSGWYKDLYSSPKPAATGSGESAPPAAGDGAATPAPAAAGDSKPAAPAANTPTPAASTSGAGS